MICLGCCAEWVEIAQKAGWVVLLDIAAYCPTNTLDLSKIQPDFCSVSCYKVGMSAKSFFRYASCHAGLHVLLVTAMMQCDMLPWQHESTACKALILRHVLVQMFGYPTGVGCLLVRKSALKLIAQRPWFAGGTVQMVYPDGRPMMMPEDEPDRYAALLKGSTHMLQPILQWVRQVPSCCRIVLGVPTIVLRLIATGHNSQLQSNYIGQQKHKCPWPAISNLSTLVVLTGIYA